MILNQSRRLDLSETGEAERLLLSFLRGTRRLALRSREREDSEPEFETESESDSLESDAESESEADDSDSDEVLLDLRAFFVGGLSESVVFCFSLSFSLASKIKFAVPLFFLNCPLPSPSSSPMFLRYPLLLAPLAS